ncbi:MAG: hypothetical protein ACFHU9_07470 [Fluviicola sp.]
MKTLLAALIIFCGLPVFAQTSVIRLKSHHGDMEDLHLSQDKFGIPPPQRWIDTIERINETCVVHYIREQDWGMEGETYFKDTVCDHWHYQQTGYDPKEIEKSYGYEIIFIGFDKEGSDRKAKSNPFFNRQKKSNIRWLLLPLLILGLGAYIFQPRLSWKN